MINITIHTQPDDETCGPTCLHAVYGYYGYHENLENIISTLERSLSGGTLTPMLGKHAASRGFETILYVNNLEIFDPTWFHHGESYPDELIAKLESQMLSKNEKQLIQSSNAYIDYLRLGGKIRFETITGSLLKSFFKQNIPILTGLSATYLYRSPRERFTAEGVSIYDDIHGTPCGHFVILCGYDESNRHIVVADPHRENPLFRDSNYRVSSYRLINAIMLGVLTYDAHLLVILPKKENDANDPSH